ncbi:MAG: hypothetical protein KKB70_10520 [Proteobacteria bacterium]|nr:hypothetical protein [Pseudomonadota bacterium]MBU1568444.1 hypothetical protein [Pseudomonadota bacterium]
MPNFKKGERVFVPSRNVYGAVVKGGKKMIDVAYDGMDINGCRTILSISADRVETSTEPLPADKESHPAMAYTVTKYKEHKELSEDCPAISAVVCKDGVPIINVSNSGHGGCNMYYQGEGFTHEDVKEFKSSVRAAYVQFGQENPFEPADSWVQWAGELRNLGVSLEDEIKADIESWRKLKG